MNKLYLYLILVMFFVIPVQSVQNIDLLDEKGFREPIEDMSEFFLESNITYSITTERNIEYFFASKEYIAITFNNGTFFGVHQGGVNKIYLNIERMHEYNEGINGSQEDFVDEVSNTFKHEIMHLIFDEAPYLFDEMSEALNITYLSGTIMDFNSELYWRVKGIELSSNISDIKPSLRYTVDFNDVYDVYDEDRWAEETMVRLIALCYVQKESVTSLYDTVEFETYDICNEIDFPPAIKGRLNTFIGDFLEMYIVEFKLANPDIAKTGIEVKRFIPEVLGGVGSGFIQLAPAILIFVIGTALALTFDRFFKIKIIK